MVGYYLPDSNGVISFIVNSSSISKWILTQI